MEGSKGKPTFDHNHAYNQQINVVYTCEPLFWNDQVRD